VYTGCAAANELGMLVLLPTHDVDAVRRQVNFSALTKIVRSICAASGRQPEVEVEVRLDRMVVLTSSVLNKPNILMV
jgi:hypothetical protein